LTTRRLEGRSSLVNLRRLEPPRGKRLGRGRVLGRWSHQMSFKKSSSKRGKGNVPWVELPGKLGERLWDSLPKCR
jgi:hypothetical protein